MDSVQFGEEGRVGYAADSEHTRKVVLQVLGVNVGDGRNTDCLLHVISACVSHNRNGILVKGINEIEIRQCTIPVLRNSCCRILQEKYYVS